MSVYSNRNILNLAGQGVNLLCRTSQIQTWFPMLVRHSKNPMPGKILKFIRCATIFNYLNKTFKGTKKYDSTTLTTLLQPFRFEQTKQGHYI